LICRCLATPSYLLRTPEDLESIAKNALRSERARSVSKCNEFKNDNDENNICPPSKYRLPTGECNNVSHRKWGARGDIFLRLLNADYSDGVSQPRSSHGTHALPDADYVIDQLQHNFDAKLRHPHITAMLPAWGQLLANDLYEYSQLPINGKCCNTASGVKDPKELQQCYVRSGSDCKEYRRTAPGSDSSSCNKSK